MFLEAANPNHPTANIASVPLKAISDFVVRCVMLAARELRIRRAIEHLAEFDDASLRDIGFSRMEIEPAVR